MPLRRALSRAGLLGLSAAALLSLGACGQKGPLRLPSATPAASAASAPATPLR